jgi:phage-related protein
MTLAPRCVAILLTVTTLVVAAPAATAGASSSRPTPKQWAKTVCSSIDDWITSVEKTISSLGDADTLRDAVDSASKSIEKATDQLLNTFEGLELPQTKNAKQARQALEKLGDQLDSDVQDIEDALSSPGNDPVDIASTFADIGTAIQQAIDQVQAAAHTLQGLDRNGQLQKALKSSPACTELKNAV